MVKMSKRIYILNNITCFLIGNRNTPYSVKEQLGYVVEQHIVEYNVTTFIVGNYGNFDRIAHDILIDVKSRHTNISLYLLAPYALSKKVNTPMGFDGTLYPEGLEKLPLRLAIIKANQYMVNHSNYLITYCHYIGNTRNVVEYAQKLKKSRIIKITML